MPKTEVQQPGPCLLEPNDKSFEDIIGPVTLNYQIGAFERRGQGSGQKAGYRCSRWKSLALKGGRMLSIGVRWLREEGSDKKALVLVMEACGGDLGII